MYEIEVIILFDINKIFAVMRQQHITAKELAHIIGISAANFTEWKKGRNQPSGNMVLKIADYFQLPIEYFYTDEYKKKASPEEIEAELIKTFRAIGIIGPDANPTQEQLDYLVKQFKIFADGYLRSDQKDH